MEDLLFHPRFVHFPIALLSTYVLLEVIGVIFKKDFFSKAAHLILFLGVLGALMAVLSGDRAEEIAEKLFDEKDVIIPFGAIHEHEDWATITVWYFAGLLVLRTIVVLKKSFKGIFQYIFILLAVLGMYFVYETGEHGAKLVYGLKEKGGVGTELKESLAE
ncbi:MAG TPA: DUF2231 domain-containing protein [Ignavibacteriaceae bacterium]|nr:DUF2231 domain-containing protein [Ignavibacteriaceae bacterium]